MGEQCFVQCSMGDLLCKRDNKVIFVIRCIFFTFAGARIIPRLACLSCGVVVVRLVCG